MKSKAIFFDRDGVINERILGGYVRSWSEFRFMPDVGEFLKEAKDKGYIAIVITNQRGVGLGLMSEEDLNEIHRRMQEELLQTCGVTFDAIISCTDAANESGRRKPSPAMLLEAQAKFGIEMASSWMIGDTASDIEAGIRAGTKTAFLLNEHDAPSENATICIPSLKELLEYI
ncbi:MAG: HAD family hydrolase [Bacteroidota bacterium]|nr:HAD family hydrolase [Bacteroidota bacterium]